jgi:hypothetical protein
MAGINFEYPESAMKSVRWLGRGPYRAWQNRTHGGVLDVWQKDYNDPLPGETFAYPEFKGYFRDWQWASFGTSEGAFTVTNGTPGSFLGSTRRATDATGCSTPFRRVASPSST